MKAIIAGGRDYELTEQDVAILNDIHKKTPISEVVSGGAHGADFGGEMWAATQGLMVKRFPADWSLHGRAAGPIRNREMAAYADALIAFPGGKGTRNMISEARKAGLVVFEVRS